MTPGIGNTTRTASAIACATAIPLSNLDAFGSLTVLYAQRAVDAAISALTTGTAPASAVLTIEATSEDAVDATASLIATAAPGTASEASRATSACVHLNSTVTDTASWAFSSTPSVVAPTPIMRAPSV